MNAELHLESGDHTGQAIAITQDKFLIGREKDCQFRPDSELVSRHHCVLRQDEYTLRVRDMGSRNGTFVNGRRIQGEVVLADGDRLLIGDVTVSVVLAARRPASADVTKPDAALDSTGVYDGNTMPATANAPAPAEPPPAAEPRIPTPVAPREESAGPIE